MTINLSLILEKKTRIQKHFPLSVLVFIDSLVVSASQDAGGHTLSRQNNLTFGIGLHAVGVRTVARRLTKFSRMVAYQIFYLKMSVECMLERCKSLHDHGSSKCDGKKYSIAV